MNQLSHIYFTGAKRCVSQSRQSSSCFAVSRPFARQATASRPKAKVREKAVLDPFLDWLLRRGNMIPEHYRPEALQRRLPACLRALKVHSTADAKSQLETHASLVPLALNSVLIGVSQFFRDPQVFEVLEKLVLPRLLQGPEGVRRNGLRVLSAACSEGQELYSVGMLLGEIGGLPGSILIGLDARAEAIEAARRGFFANSELETLRPSLRERYFEPYGAGAMVVRDLRARSSWRISDLLKPADLGSFDLILYRNLGIYLEPAGAQLICDHLIGQLRPGGVLMTGKAERPSAGLPLRRIAPCLYEKRASPTAP